MLVFFCQKRGLKKQNFHTKTAINYLFVRKQLFLSEISSFLKQTECIGELFLKYTFVSTDPAGSPCPVDSNITSHGDLIGYS